jgi:hypothetical protein
MPGFHLARREFQRQGHGVLEYWSDGVLQNIELQLPNSNIQTHGRFGILNFGHCDLFGI